MQYKVFFYPRNNEHILLANKLNMQLEQCKIYGQISAVKICDIVELCGMFRDEIDAETVVNATRVLVLLKKNQNLIYSGNVFYIELLNTDNNEQN